VYPAKAACFSATHFAALVYPSGNSTAVSLSVPLTGLSYFSHNLDGLSGFRSLSFGGVAEADGMPVLR
jgi:hypothetical protein